MFAASTALVLLCSSCQNFKVRICNLTFQRVTQYLTVSDRQFLRDRRGMSWQNPPVACLYYVRNLLLKVLLKDSCNFDHRFLETKILALLLTPTGVRHTLLRQLVEE